MSIRPPSSTRTPRARPAIGNSKPTLTSWRVCGGENLVAHFRDTIAAKISARPSASVFEMTCDVQAIFVPEGFWNIDFCFASIFATYPATNRRIAPRGSSIDLRQVEILEELAVDAPAQIDELLGVFQLVGARARGPAASSLHAEAEARAREAPLGASKRRLPRAGSLRRAPAPTRGPGRRSRTVG